MSIYHDVIYRNYPPSTFPEKLAKVIADRYFSGNPGYCEICHRRGKELLDIGCGKGEYLKAFRNYGYKVHGIDNECNIEEEIPLQSDSIDYIFCKSVIEHIQDPESLLRDMKRVLKPKGRFVILTPAWEYNYFDFYNDPTHVKPYHRKGLQDLLLLHEFRNVKVIYFYYLPQVWKRSWLIPLIRPLSLLKHFKWKDQEETRHRPFIRFSQEVQLLATGQK